MKLSKEFLEMANAEPGGLMACSPEFYQKMTETIPPCQRGEECGFIQAVAIALGCDIGAETLPTGKELIVMLLSQIRQETNQPTMTDLAQMQQSMAAVLGWKNLYTLPNSEGGRFVAGIPPTTDRTDDDAYDAIPKWGVDWGETMRLVTQVRDMLEPGAVFSIEPTITEPGHRIFFRWFLFRTQRHFVECSDNYTDPEQGPLHALQACCRACEAAGLLKGEPANG